MAKWAISFDSYPDVLRKRESWQPRRMRRAASSWIRRRVCVLSPDDFQERVFGARGGSAWTGGVCGSIEQRSSVNQGTTSTRSHLMLLATQYRLSKETVAAALRHRLAPVALASDAVPRSVVEKWMRQGSLVKLVNTLARCPDA